MALYKTFSWFFISLFCSYLNITSCDPECDDVYNIDNKSYDKCDLNQHLNEPTSEFKRGDYFELFDRFGKQSYTLISIKHQETDGQYDRNYVACFFCISFYNVSSGKFEVQDKLMLDYHKKTESLNKFWEGRREGSDPNLISYDIGTKSGKTSLRLKSIYYPTYLITKFFNNNLTVYIFLQNYLRDITSLPLETT